MGKYEGEVSWGCDSLDPTSSVSSQASFPAEEREIIIHNWLFQRTHLSFIKRLTEWVLLLTKPPCISSPDTITNLLFCWWLRLTLQMLIRMYSLRGFRGGLINIFHSLTKPLHYSSFPCLFKNAPQVQFECTPLTSPIIVARLVSLGFSFGIWDQN